VGGRGVGRLSNGALEAGEDGNLVPDFYMCTCRGRMEALYIVFRKASDRPWHARDVVFFRCCND